MVRGCYYNIQGGCSPQFPKLIFYTRELGSLNEFSFDYKDLFTETKYKYFFNIIFEPYEKLDWKFGKIFLKKYPINFDYDSETMEVYDSYYQEKDKEGDNKGNNEDSFWKSTTFYIIIVAALVIVTGVVGFFNENVDDFFV